MIAKSDTRELLIDSCHSSKTAEAELESHLSSPEFVALLVRIAVDAEDYEGDAPMQAAYYLSMAPPNLTQAFETDLIKLLTTADGYGGHVALALGRMHSMAARPMIANELRKGDFPSAWLYRKALEAYDAPLA